jgi:hypothetical protein
LQEFGTVDPALAAEQQVEKRRHDDFESPPRANRRERVTELRESSRQERVPRQPPREHDPFRSACRDPAENWDSRVHDPPLDRHRAPGRSDSRYQASSERGDRSTKALVSESEYSQIRFYTHISLIN